MSRRTVKIVKIAVDGLIESLEIEKSLDGLQAQVGGMIEALGIDERCHAYINEEGKLEGLAGNLIATQLMHRLKRIGRTDVIVGPMILLGDDGEGDEADVDLAHVRTLLEPHLLPLGLGRWPELEQNPAAFEATQGEVARWLGLNPEALAALDLERAFPATAQAVVNQIGFVTSEQLPVIAAAWPTCRILVRCHSYRFVVTADQAAPAIEQQGEQLRDVAILAEDFPRLTLLAHGAS